MKKPFALAVMLAAILMTACQNDLYVADGLSVNSTTKQFNFTVKGSFTDKWQPVTRGSLAADGQELTDLWILDYQNGALVQQLHQTSNDADFGTPSLNLTLGNHHVYFIASNGTTPTLSTPKHIITWEKVGDTFYKDLVLTVEASANSNRTVTLDRSVTKLNLTILDAIKEGTSTFIIMPHVWYYGIDYFTGRPTSQQTDQPIFVECPSSNIGLTDREISVFGFSSTTEWTNNITLYATDGTFVIAQADINNAPFKRNRATAYSGALFGTEGTMSLTVNDTWDDSETGTW